MKRSEKKVITICDNLNKNNIMTITVIQQKIFEIRKHKVMLDSDLAELYEVETKYLKRAVRANIKRFPPDFMFELNKKEWEFLRCNFSTLETGRGKYSKYLPFAFTEQGVAMLSGIINSEKAININIAIMRAFVEIRHHALNYKEIVQILKQHEGKFKDVYQALDYLLNKDKQQVDFSKRKRIGYKPIED